MLTEPTQLLEGNELLVEHRFFGSSIATDPDWTHLNIWQSANDSHRIREVLGLLYDQPWIGTGVSKGGMTAIFHHRFFPDDLAGIVPYVAPITFGFEDARYQTYMDTIGPSNGLCRHRVEGMEREMIERRAEAAQYVASETTMANGVSQETIQTLVAQRVTGYPMMFWQYWGSTQWCNHLPPEGVEIDVLFGQWMIGEAEQLFYRYGFEPHVGPYSYQVANELGQPFYTNPQVEGLLDEIDFGLLAPYEPDPMPWGDDPSFDAGAMTDVDDYLRHEASEVLAVYGAWDPWSAAMITLNEEGDNRRYIAQGATHGATLSDLPGHERDKAIEQLMGWLYPDGTPPQAFVATGIGQEIPTWQVEGHRLLADAIREAERDLMRLRILSQP